MVYSLGAVDPLIHRKPELLSIDRSQDHPKWLTKLDRQVADSREEFIIHHRNFGVKWRVRTVALHPRMWRPMSLLSSDFALHMSLLETPKSEPLPFYSPSSTNGHHNP